MLELFGHPFSSYTQKVLIALWANETPFEYRLLESDHPENAAILKQHSPFGLFPLLLDDGQPVIESTPIIEHLQAHHPGRNIWIPEGEPGRDWMLVLRESPYSDIMTPTLDARLNRGKAVGYVMYVGAGGE